jgi:hypothetical protein
MVMRSESLKDIEHTNYGMISNPAPDTDTVSALFVLYCPTKRETFQQDDLISEKS